MKYIHYIILFLAITLISCEKEIDIDLPPSSPQWVVEASINQFSPTLNYVFITKSVDYFKPDLTSGGEAGADVRIVKGRIVGNDTIYDGTETQFFSIGNIPGADTLIEDIELLNHLQGIYLNPAFVGEVGAAYQLRIQLKNGHLITGSTHIPEPINIDTILYSLGGNPDEKGREDVFLTFFWNDPPEQNNYRLFVNKSTFNFLLGWGAVDIIRTFDDRQQNGVYRGYSFFSPFKQQDTVNLYLTTIGRSEYQFWESFSEASSNGGPFATPIQLKSNINGAIGTFTGFGVAYKREILN
jgi:hypothetical protein